MSSTTEFLVNQLFDKFKLEQTELLDKLQTELQAVLKTVKELPLPTSGTVGTDQETTILLAIENLIKQEQEIKSSHTNISPSSSSPKAANDSSERVDIIKQTTKVVEYKNDKTGAIELFVEPVPNGYSFEVSPLHSLE